MNPSQSRHYILPIFKSYYYSYLKPLLKKIEPILLFKFIKIESVT